MFPAKFKLPTTIFPGVSVVELTPSEITKLDKLLRLIVAELKDTSPVL